MIILLFNQTVLFLFIQGLFQSFCPQNIRLLRNLRFWLKLMPNIKEKKTSYKTIYCYAVMVEYTPLERSSLSSLICQPVVFFFSIYSSSNFIRAVNFLIFFIKTAIGCLTLYFQLYITANRDWTLLMTVMLNIY